MPINTTRCPHCGARVNHIVRSDEAGQGGKTWSMNCPRCKQEFAVDVGDLSGRTREEIEELRAFDQLMNATDEAFIKADIAKVVAPVLEGNVREIVGKMELKSMISDREQFAKLVKESAEPDMNALGLTIKTFNVQNFSDRNGVIDALGVENQAQIMKDAAVSKAKNEQIVREEAARAERAANQAEVESKAAIAERENDLRIRKAALKQESDAKQAEADVAYQLQEEQQRADLERRTADADIACQEKEIELEEKRVAVEQKRLEAEINKKDDADLYKAERDAEAAIAK